MTPKLEQFRLDLYEALPYRRDTLLDLLDALAGNTTARSVVELSLSPFFRREYSSITDGTDNFFQATTPEQEAEARREWEQKLVRVIAPYLAQPQKRKYWLFGVDVTSLPRPYAGRLADRLRRRRHRSGRHRRGTGLPERRPLLAAPELRRRRQGLADHSARLTADGCRHSHARVHR